MLVFSANTLSNFSTIMWTEVGHFTPQVRNGETKDERGSNDKGIDLAFIQIYGFSGRIYHSQEVSFSIISAITSCKILLGNGAYSEVGEGYVPFTYLRIFSVPRWNFTERLNLFVTCENIKELIRKGNVQKLVGIKAKSTEKSDVSNICLERKWKS